MCPLQQTLVPVFAGPEMCTKAGTEPDDETNFPAQSVIRSPGGGLPSGAV